VAKAFNFIGFFGTTKVVPFQNQNLIRGSLEAGRNQFAFLKMSRGPESAPSRLVRGRCMGAAAPVLTLIVPVVTHILNSIH
jgi:hypothetical protein